MDVLSGDKTLEVFTRKKMRLHRQQLSRSWLERNPYATSMVINGEAAMQIMGDWAGNLLRQASAG